MEDLSLILNTGIQLLTLDEELTLDLGGAGDTPADNVKVWFYEFQIKDKVYLDPVYRFPDKNKFLRRNDLICSGYLDPITNEMAPSSVINPNMNWIDMNDPQLIKISSLESSVGVQRESAIDLIENKWLPMPMYEKDMGAAISEPSNWCRIKLIPLPERSTRSKRRYKVVIAFDTDVNLNNPQASPSFNGQPYKLYALCGMSWDDFNSLSEKDQKQMVSTILPLKAYEFCDKRRNPWLDNYLRTILDSEDLNLIPLGKKCRYLSYYTYLITYLHQANVLPQIKLYNDAGVESINTNLVLDIGNSRTFGLVAEDPLGQSWSKSSVIELHDLETGEIYDRPFDMRLCFKQERFGLTSIDRRQFSWPSIVRLGREAERNIYGGEQDLMSTEQFDTSHSSPKRYLWDNHPFRGQWKFVSERERVVGPAQTVWLDGIGEQFSSSGEFMTNPQEMGNRSAYSRRSLMTFCFMEILLQVKMQINSLAFRKKNGNESRKREITRIILTCPTAMPRKEQVTLRKCMEEASIVLRRFYNNTYNEPYDAERDFDKVEIIPSVQDLMMSCSDASERQHWNYDEATCCQMVYMYSEMRRYLGNTREFFGLYGRKRNGEQEPSLTVASIDIGAGTTDIMICNYRNGGNSIVPVPLFWETFHTAGDELVKKIIENVLIENPQEKYPGASGIITARLREIGCRDVPNTMHTFFGDGHSMGVVQKRMRKEFTIQVLIPIANYLLDMLQRELPDQPVKFEDIFKTGAPAKSLLDYFADHMGFRIEDTPIIYSKEYLNQIVCNVFEPSFRKWAAIFYTYNCDIVLMAGRPCSLKQVNKLLRRLYAVSPNRLISMNDYRVGSWYPGSSGVGHFGDKKSMVAVGALISYLADTGGLKEFNISTQSLKRVTPTSEFIGLLNPSTGLLENFITPDTNKAKVDISAFPLQLGTKQLNVGGYPAQMLYMLDFNDDTIRREAIERLRSRKGLMEEGDDTSLQPNEIADEMNVIKFQSKQYVPLRFRFEREYREDKENVVIESVMNSEHDDLPVDRFAMVQQSWAEDEANWLDSGTFIMHIKN